MNDATGAGPPVALLRLFHLVSPALPVGAYAYSQGMEYAVQAGWVADEAAALAWLRGLAGRAVGTLDLPVLLRLAQAWQRGEAGAAAAWNERLLAARETQELRAEDQQLGRALLRILAGQGIEPAAALLAQPQSFANGFALAGVRWGIAPPDLLSGYLWAWTENQVLAAIKLVPLGQSAGQRLLAALIEDMPAVVRAALALPDEDIGASAVSQSIASALHETQYTRLFRS
jgi:urease accessory protein